MTHLCVSIYVNDLDKARRDVALAAEFGADLVELRIDSLEDESVLETLLRENRLPYLVTCRPTWEGGQSEFPDERRIKYLDQAVVGGARYVDVELGTVRRVGKKMVAAGPCFYSFHDFTGRPAKLNAVVQEIYESAANVAKIVWTARTIRDNLEAFEILLHRQKPTIALCMGEAGLISRVLAKKFGGFVSYCALTRAGGTAPGQIAIEDMKRLYRWDAIGPRTKVHGVVASPVMHSMSPAIHNASFDAINFDGVYLPLLVNEGYESFKAFMESFLAFEPLHLSGLSITLPHKENALRYLKEKGAEIEPLAETIGAVNTIVIKRSSLPTANCQLPTIRGFNSDYAAILDSITAKMNISREKLPDYRFAVLGAGGTGRTAVAALAHYGATVVIYNRTLDRAQALANEFNGRKGKVVAAPMEKLCDSCCHVYINTTSVGMHPNVEASPLGDNAPEMNDQTVVFDTIYNPMKTKLLAYAESRGAKTIQGVEMFVRQAAAQFEAWTGKPAPTDVMRRVVEARLKAS